MSLPGLLSLFGRLDRPFLVPAKTASAAARGRGQGRPDGRRATRASLDGGEHGCTLFIAGTTSRTPRAWRATACSWLLAIGLSLAHSGFAQAGDRAAGINADSVAIQEASMRFGIPSGWIEAVIAAESGGDGRAVSAKGAMGLMQLMPGTWREMRTELGLGADPFDHRDNVMAGAAYLRRLFDRFGAGGFLAAYNAGPGRYQAFLDGAKSLPPETIDYVARVQVRIVEARAQSPEPRASTFIDWRKARLFVGPMDGGAQDHAPSETATLFVQVGPEVQP